MTEDLLALMTLIAIWKVVQVWTLKARVRQAERTLVICEAQRDWASTMVRDHITNDTADAEWPERIN